MPFICAYHACTLTTPHDGDHVDIDVEVYEGGGGRPYAATDDTGALAYLDCDCHRLWSLNPGLREALLDRVRCATLVKG
jgi:hypothetical protein